MIKLRIQWELETGEKFDEWTRPVELAQAEKELFEGKSILKVLREEGSASHSLCLFLGHKMQQRVTNKIENFDLWKKKVLDIGATEYDNPNFTKPEVSGEQQSN
jgi:hypothetical protein